MTYSIQEINEVLKGTIVGDTSMKITAPEQLELASASEISFIGPKVVLGENVTIYPNVTILDECTIGKNTIIWSGAVIRERCHLGSNCIIHPNATIGADGFGFRPCAERGLVKIPQIGNVILGN